MKFSAGVASFVVVAAAGLAAARPSGYARDLYARQYDDAVELFARWGSGKYTLDDDTYHRVVKPQFISAFSGEKSFSSLCGSNPDFFIEKNGDVYPSAVGKFKASGKCTKSKFTKNLGHIVKAAQPRSRSPSPSRHRRAFWDFDDLD